MQGRDVTIFEAQFEKPSESLTVPFCNGCYFLDSTDSKVRKFEAKAELGVIVGYGSHKAYKVLSTEAFKEGVFRIIITRDVRILWGQFPLIELDLERPDW